MEDRSGHVGRRAVVLGILGSTGSLAACSGSEPAATPTSDTFTGVGPSSSGTSVGTSSSSSSASSSSASSSGALATVDLPSPSALRDRWAAFAAVWAAGEFSSEGGPAATEGDWYYEDVMDASWAFLVRFEDGRAVLAGAAEPASARAVADERTTRAELVDGAPGWWAKALDALPARAPVSFVCGWTKADGWQQVADAPTDQGLADSRFILRSEDDLVEELVLMANTGAGDPPTDRGGAARALVTAGPDVTSAQLRALGPDMRSPAAGVRAASAFADPGVH